MSADHHNKNVTSQTGPVGKPAGFQRKTITLGLLLIGLVIGTCSVLITQAGSPRAQQRLIDSLMAQLPAAQARNLDTAVVHQTFRSLQYRLAAVTAALVLTLAGAMLIAVRKIARPIDEMGQAAELIAGGHLDLAPPTGTFTEIKKVGLLINDLAMNLQEILLLTWNHTGEHRESLRRLSDVLAKPDNGEMAAACRAEIEVLDRKVENMRTMVKAFDFYDVRLSGAAPLSASDSEASTATLGD